MPKKRQTFDSDTEEDEHQPTKRSKTEAKEVITIDSDEEVVKTPKTPKAKKKEVQKNTLDKYFGFSSKTTPKASKDKEKDKAVTPKASRDKEKDNAVTPKASKDKEKDDAVTPKASKDKEKDNAVTPKASGSKIRLDESPKRATIISPKKLSDTSQRNLEFRKSPTKLVLNDEDVKKKVSPTSKENHQKIKLETEVKSKNGEKSGNVKPSTSESVNERKRKIKDEEKVVEKGKSTPAAKPKMGEKRRSGGGGNYAAYMNRDGPRGLGTKEIPEGEPNCLSGLTFVLTGVLESIEREDAKELVEKCGGKVTGSLSKKTTYVVVGREPGISKLNKADQLKVKQINEDELFELIRSKMSSDAKPVQKKAKSIDETESAYFSSKNEAEPSKSSVADEPTKGSPTKLKESPKGDLRLKQSPVKSKVHPSSIPGPETKAKSEKDSCSLLWVDKYRPRSLKQLIGQQTPGSVAQKLLVWLRSWHRHMEEGTKKSGSVGFTRGARDDGCLFKAALLSGPPGIGKTTTATLVCEELGFSFVELNASDTRSKRSLREKVSETVGSHSVVDFLQESNKSGKKHCLLMDEVDGMAGNEDRGGVGELIQVIKQSKIPIICMCNDRSHQKMRSLVNYCFDLRFQRPRVDQIKGAMMSIICKEGLSIPQSSVTEMVTASNNDIRQTINNLEMWSASDKKLTDEQVKKDSSKAKKDLRYNVFEVIKKILAPEMNDDKSIRGLSDLFFQDYQMGPLFVQENYLNVRPTASGNDPDATLTLMSKAADAIAMGDIVNRGIRTRNNWSLLTTQALFSAVLPGHYMRGNLTAGIGFPSWLGKFSSRKRCSRLLQQLSSHIRLPTGGVQPTELAMGSGKALLHHVANPLLRRGPDGVEETINILRSYDLLREDLDILAECSLWSMQRDPMSQVDSKTKAALTRTYNKSGVLTPYALTTGATKKGRGRGGGGGDDFAGEGEFEDGEENAGDEEAEDGDEDDVTKDAMVKVSKAKAGPAKKAKTKKANGGGAGPSKKKKTK